MNLNLFQLASADRSVRVVIQKKADGDFLMGVSNGKEKPLVCQGSPEAICQEIELKLAGYLGEVQTAEISAKLNEVAVEQHEAVDEAPVPLALTPQVSTVNHEAAQDIFDFDF